jgi:hypothetical protein
MTVNPVAVFWSEIWAVADMVMERWEYGRGTYGLVKEEGMWGIKTDREFREPNKDIDIAADIKKSLGWVGVVVRTDQVRRVKKIFER